VTKVTIVSRTQMFDGVCIGGLTRDDRRNVRLLPPSGEHSHPLDAPYVIGDVWDIELAVPSSLIAPHVEDQLVVSGRRVALQSGLEVWLRNNVTPWRGGASSLFDGRLHVAPSGSAFVARDAIPTSSVGFWVPTDDLVLDKSGKRYLMPWKDDRISVKYVGSDTPAAVIVAGTLVRVSLSRWFSPAGIDGCWLQISGWYASSRKAVAAGPHSMPGNRAALDPSPPSLPKAGVPPSRIVPRSVGPTRARFGRRRAPVPHLPALRLSEDRWTAGLQRKSIAAQRAAGALTRAEPAPQKRTTRPASRGVNRNPDRKRVLDRELVRQLLSGEPTFRARGRSAPIVRTLTSTPAATLGASDSRSRAHMTPLDNNHDMTHEETNLRAKAVVGPTVASIRTMAIDQERAEVTAGLRKRLAVVELAAQPRANLRQSTTPTPPVRRAPCATARERGAIPGAPRGYPTSTWPTDPQWQVPGSPGTKR
jgi:hypothetical protein